MKLWKRAAATALALVTSVSLTACAGNSNDAAANKTSDKPSANGAIEVTDVVGRTVTLDKQPERIILGEGRAVFATSIIDRDNPTNHVVAMGEDLVKAAPSYYERLTETHPEVKDVPTIGNLGKGDVSVENLVSYKPDVMTITLDHYNAAKDAGILDKMDAADIKYVVTDFRIHPLENTTKSVDIYGQILGNEKKAEEFNSEWTSTIKDVEDRVAKAEKPSVFVWRAAGYKDGVATVKNSNIGDFVRVAGGDNIGDRLLDSEFGDITMEKLIQENPDKVLATGGSWAPKGEKVGHITLGYTTEEAAARESLHNLSTIPGVDKVTAMNNGETLGMWHQFYDSPLNFLAIQRIAQWLHPELFKDLDFDKEWSNAHDKYVPFAASGTFFTTDAK
ncbi:MAG: ABC transporter substrate-binding protein [Corynebacterium sp.]|nr:ABC transporter substrate-binding protein [Corynebacterium sp.]